MKVYYKHIILTICYSLDTVLLRNGSLTKISTICIYEIRKNINVLIFIYLVTLNITLKIGKKTIYFMISFTHTHTHTLHGC